ncbi:MAG: hypothetical protein A2513_08300 [Sulfurimonas sp. RIFOXYD12_FULL_33_39]|uniref:TolC family protein n=1 Tax=unclassified Sulfurimonas TaxID=2623549 RepID=UPI0008D62537|nr:MULTISPECIES: TolC family protein [unclassified Sulfurimonas]OHE10087.1 MAG: hypothetical protein A2513_08300 [Sulfurimonas sp. RIFOXYD12_FULL_33_39]OHE14692.1 MAG: hypothetical protein A2530_02180 [Sulfurimonas sp. RIFOXYD2_FULL_34_21]DAB28781.1 MAG TPA: transporter [Sulfurimonas sp. UBA10385]
MIKFLFIYLYLLILIVNAKVLTLDECIDKTLKNHPDLKKLSLSVMQRKSLVDVAKADYMPQINFNAQYNPINTFALPQNGEFKTINDDSYQIGATANQKIYDYDKTSSTIKAYEKDENIADLSLDDKKALLVYNIKNLYDLALVHTKAIEVRQKDLQTKEELYRQAESLVKEGLKTAADATSILSAVYIAKDNLAGAKADLHKALNTLSIYMGERIDFDTVLVENSLQKNIQNKDLTLKDIFEKNFELKGFKEEILKEGLIYDASKAQHYGSIDAMASYIHQSSINSYDLSTIGVTINIPIYSGGRISAQSQQAAIAKEIAKESYNSKKLLIQEEFEGLMIDLDRYKLTLKAKEALIESSFATKEIIEARYKEGLSTYIEVLDAASTHLFAELGLIETKLFINKIINKLDYLQGQF